MSSTRSLPRKRNLLLAFDAFGTLFQPNIPIPQAYGTAALRHGIRCVERSEQDLKAEDYAPVKKAFSSAFKNESAKNPNYGKATGLGAEKWWANVIRDTFKPFMKPSQQVPEALISELLTRYSTRAGYDIFTDVLPFFRMLKDPALRTSTAPAWPWNKTVVGIITNSDDRVPSVLESFGLRIGPRRVGSSAQRRVEATTDDDISFVVLSYDVGVEKPNREMFQAAEEMLKETLAENGEGVEDTNIEDYEKLYVGDEFKKDYVGAKSAGWHSVLLDRERKLNEPLDSVKATELEEGCDYKEPVQVCSTIEALRRWRPYL
ncbi:haloacid dehalogenase [Massarina eburnea CBS 473.64]|uniref:Haloacid dehalogenase n=1 Tax=Massarina eburnea CBS 473.64 TaxID=1395130 RepID=A0A6A6SF63_9PLEO|nr:haloacid dehalogenase [Massarina eburnea CBS 473.64]